MPSCEAVSLGFWLVGWFWLQLCNVLESCKCPADGAVWESRGRVGLTGAIRASLRFKGSASLLVDTKSAAVSSSCPHVFL